MDNMIEKLNLPFQVYEVKGEEAIKLLDKNTSYVLLGDLETFQSLMEATNRVSNNFINEHLKRSSLINVESWFTNRIESDEDYYHFELGDWKFNAEESNSISLKNLSVKLNESFFIGDITNKNNLELPIFLGFGGWNECPESFEHTAILEYWDLKYGIRILAMSDTEIEVKVRNTPKTKEESLLLAKQQAIYCPDIVHQGTLNLSNLAVTLLHNNYWYFWWD